MVVLANNMKLGLLLNKLRKLQVSEDTEVFMVDEINDITYDPYKVYVDKDGTIIVEAEEI